MDTAKAITKLNDILKHEWTGIAQYAQQSFMVRGVWREVYAEMFSESAEECLGHGRKIADKIVALGGVPTIERNKIQQTDSLEDMLKQSLAFEQAAVDHYLEALEICEDNRPLVVMLEDILLEEQEGVDDITKLLRQDAAPGAGIKGTKKEKAG